MQAYKFHYTSSPISKHHSKADNCKSHSMPLSSPNKSSLQVIIATLIRLPFLRTQTLESRDVAHSACKSHKTDFSTKTCIIRLAALASPQTDASNVSQGYGVMQEMQNSPIAELISASSCVASPVFPSYASTRISFPSFVSNTTYMYMYTTQPLVVLVM